METAEKKRIGAEMRMLWTDRWTDRYRYGLSWVFNGEAASGYI